MGTFHFIIIFFLIRKKIYKIFFFPQTIPENFIACKMWIL